MMDMLTDLFVVTISRYISEANHYTEHLKDTQWHRSIISQESREEAHTMQRAQIKSKKDGPNMG